MVTPIESDELWGDLWNHSLQTGKPLLVQFTAQWCGPCKRITPDFERMAAQAGDQMLFAKVDVDGAQGVTQWAGVAAMPTFHLYHNGSLFSDAVVRGANVQQLQALVQRALALPRPMSTNDTAAAGESSAVANDAEAEAYAGRVILVDSEEEWAALIQHARATDQPVVAQFSSDNCSVCASVYPLFGEHCRANASRALFAKVNADKATSLAAAVGIQHVPTFIGIFQENTIDAFSGADKARLERLVRSAAERCVPSSLSSQYE